MENQHKKITGCRDLSQQEIDLVNTVKAMGNQMGGMIDTLSKEQGLDQRCVSEARTCLQTGFMWAVRSIEQPESF